jgi:hypothetical protein
MLQATQKRAKAKALVAFTGRGGTAADFRRSWRQMFNTVRAKEEERSLGL